MAIETRSDAASTAKSLYQALAAGDREAINALLSADFIGHAAQGLPLNMGGEHRGAEAMQRNLWWKIGKHFKVEAQPDELRRPRGRQLVGDGALSGGGPAVGTNAGRGIHPRAAVRSGRPHHLVAPAHRHRRLDRSAWRRTAARDHRLLRAGWSRDNLPEPARPTQCDRPSNGRGVAGGGPPDRGGSLGTGSPHLRQRSSAHRRWRHRLLPRVASCGVRKPVLRA